MQDTGHIVMCHHHRSVGGISLCRGFCNFYPLLKLPYGASSAELCLARRRRGVTFSPTTNICCLHLIVRCAVKRIFGVSKLSNGQGPQGKEPTRNRRRKKWRGGRNPATDGAGQSHARMNANASSSPNQPRDSGIEAIKDGSSNLAGNLAPDAGIGEANANFSSSVPKIQNKRARANDRANQSTGKKQSQLRNMRAVPQPIADVTFDPGARTGEANANSQFKNKPATERSSKPRPANKNQGPREKRLYAALDLGTNNCRLLVALPQEPGRFRVVDGFSRIVRLGEGMTQSGRLSEAAMERAIEALKICAGKLANRNIKRHRLIATEACRQAENGEEFLARVKEETGLQLEVVNRETEAKLAAEGCGALMDRKSDGAVLFDIGGGSSELILVDGTHPGKKRIADKIVAWTSLPLGVVTLAERFGGRHITADIFADMISAVEEHIDAFEGRAALEKIWRKGRVHLLGTSGTVTTLAGVHLDLPKYDRRRVDGVWLANEQIDAVISRLLSMAYEERALNPCIGRERADLVLAGCAILEAIRNTWPSPRLRVADRGLREGLLAEMINRDGAWIKHRKNRWRNSRRSKKRSARQGATG